MSFKKYEKITKEASDAWLEENKAFISKVSHEKGRLKYHLMPPVGWLNDPNGLCEKDGVNHIYFQYSPYDVDGTFKTWAHVTTKDFINYTYHDIAIYPDNELDKHGAYSGSAFVQDDTIHYFYTGNVKLFDKDDYDYINSGRLSNTIHITSKDGFDFSKKEAVLTNLDYPTNISNHIRDPKVFKYNDNYYMVLGARTVDSKGCVVMYESNDLDHWHYFTTITTTQPFGYMWECPDMFMLDGEWILICCPQGVKSEGINYNNVYQTVAMFIDVDFDNKAFTIRKIHQLDRGFDFYAPQTYQDEDGRRILIGWMGIPDAPYRNLTDGWQHALTLPRKLQIKDGNLVQTCIDEYTGLRLQQQRYDKHSINDAKLNASVYELLVEFNNVKEFTLSLRKDVLLTYTDSILCLDITNVGAGRTKRMVKVDDLRNVHIYSDVTSLEVFVNDGMEVFTTRMYCKEDAYIHYCGDDADFTYYQLGEIKQ